MDDADCRRIKPRVMNPEANRRTPYQGNKNPSQSKMALQGYETLAIADPSDPYRPKDDRPTTYEDAEYDPHYVRRLY